MKEYLLKLMSKCTSLPFLFVGSGFSRKYLELFSWEELLDELGRKVFDNPLEYYQLKQKAKVQYSGPSDYNKRMCAIADGLEEKLIATWYISEKFVDSRQIYIDEIKKETSPLKIEIANIIKERSNDEYKLQSEVDILKKIGIHSIAGVITTNYDCFAEDIFDFTTYDSQEKLLFSSTYELAEIYKIHGCVNNPSTIKITSKDYDVIEKTNKYLAAKLLTIFVEHPVIFIGYSIGDADIINILDAVVQCLSKEQIKILQERLIFIKWEENMAQDSFEIGTVHQSFSSGLKLTMTQIALSNYSLLYDAIALHKSKYSTKILRNLKKDVYNLILTNDPKGKLVVYSADEILEGDEFEFIAGVGIVDLAKRGYKSIAAHEVYSDIITDIENFNPEALIAETLSDLLKFSNGYIPCYKYIQNYTEVLPERVEKYTKDFGKFDDFKNSAVRNCAIEEKSIDEIMSKPGSFVWKINRIAHLKESEIDLDMLKELISEKLILEPNYLTNNEGKSSMRRLIRMYDFLKYSNKKSKL